LMLFSMHSIKQLKLRNISEDLVRKALSEPEQTIVIDKSRTIFHLRFKEKGKKYLLRVIADKVGPDWLIITVYKSSKIKKYWRGDFNES
jgi:hypothetical protein